MIVVGVEVQRAAAVAAAAENAATWSDSGPRGHEYFDLRRRSGGEEKCCSDFNHDALCVRVLVQCDYFKIQMHRAPRPQIPQLGQGVEQSSKTRAPERSNG